MKAILIETDKHKITEIEFSGTLEEIYLLLDIHNDSRCVTGVNFEHLADADTLYVDDNGLFNKSSLEKGTFILRGISERLVGRGIITGTNDDGDFCDVKTDISIIKKNIIMI